MRGTPFIKEDYHLGLNTIDSPYTLKEGESRDCLNVVSTERGAIRKRTGSIAFAGAVASVFSTAVKDSFKRGAEKPLSNGGKWTAAPVGENTGEINASEQWVVTGEGASQGYWNVEEQKNPAVSLEWVAGKSSAVAVLACAKLEGGLLNHYRVEIIPATGVTKIIRYWPFKKLAETTVTWEVGDSIGIGVRGEVVTAWRKRGAGSWTRLLEVNDSTYTTGFCGISAFGGTGAYQNFAFSELAAPTEIAGEITSLAAVNVAAGKILIASTGKDFYSITESGEINHIGEGFTAGSRWSIVQAAKGKAKTAGPVYMVNGKDKPQTWVGTEAKEKMKLWEGEGGGEHYEDETTKEHVPNGKYMVLHQERLYMAGMSDDQYAVRACERASIGEGGFECDPTSWVRERVTRFEPASGLPVTALATVGPYVLTFKEFGTWVIHNLDNLEYRQLSDTIGCKAGRTIKEVPGGAMFLTTDQGVYFTNGTSKMSEMSYNVRNELIKASANQKENASAAYFQNHYYVSVPVENSTSLNKTYDYDFVLKSWWRHDLAGNQWTLYSTGGAEALFTARPKAKDGVTKAFVEGLYTDHGEVYTGKNGLSAYWLAHWEPFAYYIFRHRIKAPFLKKRVREIFFNGSGEIIPIVFRRFNIAGASEPAVVWKTPETSPELPAHITKPNTEKWGEGTGRWGEGEELWGGNATVSEARIYAAGIAPVWSIGFGNNSSEGFEVDAYAYMVQFRKS